MGRYTALSDCLFSTGNTLKDGHALLHELISLNVQQIGARQAVLSDEDWLFVPLNVREELGSLAFEGRNKFGAHGVIL